MIVCSGRCAIPAGSRISMMAAPRRIRSPGTRRRSLDLPLVEERSVGRLQILDLQHAIVERRWLQWRRETDGSSSCRSHCAVRPTSTIVCPGASVTHAIGVANGELESWRHWRRTAIIADTVLQSRACRFFVRSRSCARGVPAVSAARRGRAQARRAGVARAVPRAREPADRRSGRVGRRLAAPRVPRRHVRPPPQRIADLEAAISWAVEEMKRDGLENVHTEPVKVPHWVRGRESAGDRRRHSAAAGRCSASATASARRAAGIEAELLVVRSFEELEAARDRVKGRIVLFNVALHELRRDRPFRAARPVARRRARRASRCWFAPSGRPGLRTPHTGALQYADGAAADPRRRDLDRRRRAPAADGGPRHDRVACRLTMEAQFLPDADSANVVGEIRGRELPDEVVVIGGHLDSWDVGTGATDDGGGCIVTWEALRLMKKLNLRPRRTVRVVLWTNEENGGRGGTRLPRSAPRRAAQPRDDAGVRQRRVPADRLRLQRHARRARDTVQAHRHAARAASARSDRPERRRRRHRPERAGRPASRRCRSTSTANYFLIHHTRADTVDKIDPLDMARAAAAIAVMAYVIADMPQRLR